MDSTLPIQAIALISSKNQPLYLRRFSSQSQSHSQSFTSDLDADLKFQYIAHSALDLVEERVNSNRQLQQYLGLLFSLEDLAVYGYQTSTKMKILLMFQLSSRVLQDIDVITIFRAIQTAYLSYTSNPFHLLTPSPASTSASQQPLESKPIQSKLFEETMEKIAGLKR